MNVVNYKTVTGARFPETFKTKIAKLKTDASLFFSLHFILNVEARARRTYRDICEPHSETNIR